MSTNLPVATLYQPILKQYSTILQTSFHVKNGKRTANQSFAAVILANIRCILIFATIKRVLTLSVMAVEHPFLRMQVLKELAKASVCPLYLHCWLCLASFHPALPQKLTGSPTPFLSFPPCLAPFRKIKKARLSCPQACVP